MLVNNQLPVLTAGGKPVETSSDVFGFLRDSRDLSANPELLRARMEEDGYLFLPGFLDRQAVMEARLRICEVLANDGLLDPSYPIEQAIAAPDTKLYFRPEIVSTGSARSALERVIYGEKVMEFFTGFLGGAATHYDYTWLRTVTPGLGTEPHCDIVYMGRGTHNLYTAWVPLGDVPLEVGGLIVIEGSHKDRELRDGYCTFDVDTACVNKPGQGPMDEAGFHGFGAIASNITPIRDRMGRRLLTAKEYRMGDMLVFSAYLVHGSLDNNSRQVRLSSDSRYQLASDPVDERWVGEKPTGHGGNSVRGMIC